MTRFPALRQNLASHAEGLHLRVLLKPCVNLSIHTASDARLPTYRKRQCEKSVGLANPGQPFSCSPVSPAQALELPSRPADQVGVDTQQRWSQLFSIELTVVVDPASDTRVVDRGEILQGLVTAMVKGPSPDRPADGLRCLRADGRPNRGRRLHPAHGPICAFAGGCYWMMPERKRVICGFAACWQGGKRIS